MAKNIFKEETMLNEFFKFWTVKEAIIKTDGRGLTIPLREVEVKNGKARVHSKVSNYQLVDIHQQYVLHVASQIEISCVKVEKHFFY